MTELQRTVASARRCFELIRELGVQPQVGQIVTWTVDADGWPIGVEIT